MKLTFVLILLFNLQALANVYSQTKVTLNLKSADFKKVLTSIEHQSSYHFVYSERKIPADKKVSLNVNNEEVTDVLDKILANSGFTYSELQNHLVVIAPVGEKIAPITLTGKVVDENGLGLPGATVKVKGSNNVTSTNVSGAFTITVPDKSAVLIVSFVGYNVQEVTVGERTSITIGLTPSSNTLNSVVVTALGIKREARSLGYSAQTVKGEDLVKADPPNVAEGLMGKVAGLNITVPNGVEGGSTRIVLRGNNNLLGNNQPLLVVDNVVIDNEPLQPGGKIQSNIDATNNGNTDVSQPPTDFGSFLNTINSDDIESINVLKGPTAAALYGARGANGVIIIVTKKGGKKKGFGIDYNYTLRENDPYRYIKTQHEFGNGMTEALYSANPPFYKDGNGNNREENIANDPYGPDGNIPGAYLGNGTTSPSGGPFYNYIGFPGDGASWGPRISGQPLTWWDGKTRPYTSQSNIFQSYYKKGNTQTNNLSLSAGGDLGTLRISYTRTTNDAITYNSNSATNTFNLGSSINVSSKVKVDATASYTNVSKYNPVNIYGESGNNAGNIGVGYNAVYNVPVDYNPIERGLSTLPDGSQNRSVLSTAPWDYGQQYYWWNLYNDITTFKQNQFVGSISLNAEITPWLRASGNIGLNYYTSQYETKNRPYDAAGLIGSYSNDVATTLTDNLDGRFVFHKENLVKNFNASLSVGARQYYTHTYDLAANNPGPFNYPFSYNLSNYAGANPSSLNPTENWNEMKINSLYALANLSYKNYLFLDLSATSDWSSTLQPSHWRYTYPSASLSFVFTDAFDMSAVKDWLSYGKLRVSEASSANAYLAYQNGLLYNSVNTPGFQTGLALPNKYPTNIGPQRSKSFEIGPDLGFFNDRINVNFTYYDTYSDHQILQINVAQSSGLGSVLINSGALRNRGIEFTINAKVIKTKDLSWDVTVNGAHNQNKVVSLEPGLDYLQLGTWFGSNGVTQGVHVGDNYGNIYGYGYKYANGQKVVNSIYSDGINTGNGPVLGSQYATSDAYVKIGNATPKLTGGISQTLRYKNISLYVLADFKIGGQIWSGDYATIIGQGIAPETAYERDGHGLPYTFPDGTKANVGVVLPGVTLVPGSTNQYVQNTSVVNSWWKYAGNYQSWDNVPIARPNSVFNDSWGKLRELNITYALPKDLIAKTKVFQSLSVSIIGRDLFYLFTTLPDKINPESVVSTSNVQGVQFGGLPGVRSYGFSIKAGF